ncbi:MAG TPA: 3-hydroxyacyl-ACP dehydratase FabZ family protein [Gemmatimonadaceae bacterium]
MRHFHLDRIVSLERGVTATGVRSVALSDDVFTEHFPGNPVLPGVYLLEGLAQTAGMLLWESSDHNRIAVMVSIDRARFPSFARPGDTVSLKVEIESYEESAARVRGVASVAERQVAAAGFTFSMQHPDAVIPPLYRPYWDHAADIWLGRYPGTRNTGAVDA